MRKLYLLVALLIAACPVFIGGTANAQVTLQWAKQLGGISADRSYGMAVDANGYVYTTGSFMKTVDFDPGAGTYNMTSGSGGNNDDAFVCKLDSSGNFVWAKQFGKGTSNVRGFGIAVDTSGNVYITGEFEETNDFDPGAGIYNMTSLNSTYDAFICKIDSSGNFLWAKQLGGATSWDNGNDIAIDAGGNVYTTGKFYGTVDFDPGAGTFNMISVGGWDAFISKLDASGNFVWAKQLGGTQNEVGQSIAINAGGDVYTVGRFFSSPTDFDPGAGTYNMTSYGNWDVFISKLDASGNFVWAKQFGGADSDVGNSIAIGTNGNVYTTGCFTGTADFDPGAGTYNMTSTVSNRWDIFVSKLDASGNFIWARQMSGKDRNESWGIAVDTNSNVYTTGLFLDTTDFDPGAGTYNLIPGASYDVFISKLDASGNFVWALQLLEMAGGPPPQVDWGCDIVVDSSGGTIYTTGYFWNTLDFDPGAGTYNMTGLGSTDAFVLKLSDSGLLPIELLFFDAVPQGSMVKTEWATASETNNSFFSVQRCSDGLSFETIAEVDGAGNSSIPLYYRVIDNEPLTGLSYYRLKQTDYNGNYAYSKIIAMEAQKSENALISKIHPNPTEGKFRVESLEFGVEKIEVFDLFGRKVLESKEPEIDMSSYPAGLYIWRVGEARGKVIIE